MIRTLIISLFISLVCINLYFRFRITSLFRILSKNKVPIRAAYIFNQEKLERELIPYFPAQASNIRLFVTRIRTSIFIAFGIVISITALGIILHLNA